MNVRCPECGSKGVLDAELAGQMARCSQCGVRFVAQENLSAGEGGKWYYAEGDRKIGPVSEDEFDRLVSVGTISAATLVWHKGMSGWQPLSGTRGEKTVYTSDEEQVANKESRPQGEARKDGEAIPPGRSADLVYAGGARRLFAKIIDLVFMFTLATMVEGLSRRLFPAAEGNVAAIDKVYIVTMLIDMLLGMIYMTWFVGKFGATPGKMVFNLKVVAPSGGKVGYGQSFGRYWAESVIIVLTLLLGYLPILFDPEKRGLHDRLCNTRVVRI